MARPKKKGLDYFPFDTWFFGDVKIKRLITRYGTKGVAVYIWLLCAIYRNGYFIRYDEDLILDISDDLRMSENATKEVVSFLLSRSLFDPGLAKSDKVITSRSVQSRFQEVKKSSRSVVEVEGKFWLLEKDETYASIQLRHNDDFYGNNCNYSNKNSDNYRKNSDKEKESKGKESKVYSSSRCETHLEMSAVKAYARTLIDYENADKISEKFLQYYQNTGWKTRSGTPITDWRQTLKHWVDTEKKEDGSYKKFPQSDNAAAYQDFVDNWGEYIEPKEKSEKE